MRTRRRDSRTLLYLVSMDVGRTAYERKESVPTRLCFAAASIMIVVARAAVMQLSITATVLWDSPSFQSSVAEPRDSASSRRWMT